MSSKILCSSLLQRRSSLTSLPDELVVEIIARVPRCYHPTLSLVSKRFRSIIASPELYKTRSLLGCSELCLYALLSYGDPNKCRLYIYKRDGFVLVPSLPSFCYRGGFVTVGSKIYVVDGMTPSMLIIDCKFHTVQRIPIDNIPKHVVGMPTVIIDSKIYVIVECKPEIHEYTGKKVVMVLDTETQMWEPGVINPNIEIKGPLWDDNRYDEYDDDEMVDKIYMSDSSTTFAYGPKERKWEMDQMLDSERWLSGCVIDDILYYYDDSNKKLRVYDPKQKCWGMVKGVGDLLPKLIYAWAKHAWPAHALASHTVSYGGKLAVFLITSESGVNKTWCAEISLQRHQGGEIWGNVEYCEVVIAGRFLLTKALAVMV